MYIKDDICYAGELEDGIEVAEATPLRGGMMLVTFSTGEKRLFDRASLHGPVFAPLTDDTVFCNPMVFNGVLTWNNGEIDIAPETLYRNSFAYQSAKNFQQ